MRRWRDQEFIDRLGIAVTAITAVAIIALIAGTGCNDDVNRPPPTLPPLNTTTTSTTLP